jgi:steroid delta-isomerase-like uncharacterized protein
MSVEENKALVRRYLGDAFAEVQRGNLAATDELLASDATFYDPGAPPSVGREAQRQRSTVLVSAFPTAHFTIEEMVAEGDKVAVRWTFNGTHEGPFMGLPPTGKNVTMTGITIYRIVNGKIQEAWSNFDQLGVLQQLGVVPVQGQAG